MTIVNKPYRPSNGTEGEAFESRWCDRCAHHDPDGDACDILLRAHFNEQPDEWIYVNDTPTCTAFRGDPLPEPRCPHTMEMFPDGQD